MTIAEWAHRAEAALQAQGVAASRLEAQVLLAHALKVRRSWVLAHPEETAPSSADNLLRRRLRHEPLAYIIGYREFYGRPFQVGPGVLVPRQETETLIDAALESLLPEDARVLDLGTGSGCLAITLALERPSWTITASDVSEKALTWARLNALAFGASIELEHLDGPEAFVVRSFDLVVSNPPYVRTRDPLPPDVAEYEPRLALLAGEDGLDMYRRLAAVPEILSPGGLLLLEHGDDQASSVASVFQAWEPAGMWHDMAGYPRVQGFRRRE